MRAGDLFGHTLREAPADADIPSHRLLVRGGFLRRVAAGIYSWLPLGLRVLRRVENIVREEMDAAGAVELLMPALLPRDMLAETGRWESFGVELYRLRDASDRDWYLGPTHEEVVTFLASTELSSYRDLPQVPYQIQWKYRDAPRPRGGLLRGREFLMKDAYSFDADREGLQASYERMVGAYTRIFERCGITARTIEAQAGVIGGSVNHEFVQPSPNGEDTFVRCEGCEYAANTEAATSRGASYDFGDPPEAPEKVHTPGMVTVEDVAGFLGVEGRQLVKALLYRAGDEVVCALVPGDRELNEYKLRQALGGVAVEMLTDAEFRDRGWAKGFSGPVDLDGVRLLADRSLEGARNIVTGANEADHHLVGVVVGRDFTPERFMDLAVARDGDRCDRCGGTLRVECGIEVAHVFQLGTRYSEAMGATFTDPDGGRRPFVMGCYGLGVSRAVATIVEEHHDDRGIVWPRAVAPYQVVILLLSADPEARRTAEALHLALDVSDIGCVLDDREGVSAGVKFADADLVGYPLQLVVGKSFLQSGKLEAKIRATTEKLEVTPDRDAVERALLNCP